VLFMRQSACEIGIDQAAYSHTVDVRFLGKTDKRRRPGDVALLTLLRPTTMHAIVPRRAGQAYIQAMASSGLNASFADRNSTEQIRFTQWMDGLPSKDPATLRAAQAGPKRADIDTSASIALTSL